MRYDPCGRIVEMVRRPYRTACRFNRDSDQTETIHWYIVPASNGTLGIPSPINSLCWRDNWENPGTLGEVSFEPQEFDGWGRIVPPTPGDHLCGTEDDFRNGGRYLPDLPPFPRADDGIALCCRPEIGGIGVGGATWFADPLPAGGIGMDGFAFLTTIFPGLTALGGAEVEPDRWYLADTQFSATGWIRWPALDGEVWAVDFGYSAPPNYLPGYPFVQNHPADDADHLPWDALSDSLGVFTYVVYPFFTWPDAYLKVGYTDNPRFLFRVRRLS